MKKYTSGYFGIPTREQYARMNSIRARVRAKREVYECVMAPDPSRLKDVDGNLYWGSYQHLLETMLKLLELEMSKAL